MCRSIKVLYNFDPPATDAEIRGASLQFVRKLSGFSRPSKVNEPAFNRAVEEITAAARTLLDSLVTTAEPRNREVEAERAHARALRRFPERGHSAGHEHTHGRLEHHHEHGGPLPAEAGP